MTREELLELAVLDALGLLDEYEAALFTRSYHHASVPVQDEIKELQESFASEPPLLPEVEPPSHLRSHVLSRVNGAIEAETATLAPLATIGRSAPVSRAVASRPVNNGNVLVWRAAAFILAASALALGYVLTETVRHNSEIARVFQSVRTGEELEELIGPFLLTYLADETAQYCVLKPRDDYARAAHPNVHANMWVREGDDDALLIVTGLPTDRHVHYTLAYRDADGTRHEVAAELDNSSERTGRHPGIQVTSAMIAAAVSWEVEIADLGAAPIVLVTT